MLLDSLNMNTTILLSIAIMLIAAFLLTRITKRLKLPNVTGYILAGIIIGPHVLNLIPNVVSQGMEFMTDLALAFIAFGVGRYLKLDAIKENSLQVIIITLCESLIAGAIVTLTMFYIFKLPLSLALLLGAIGSATAPASTIMTIRQYKAKGPFVNLVLQVVALDDAVALVAFSICAAVVQSLNGDGNLNLMVFVWPLIANLLLIGLGILLGLGMNKLINDKRSTDNRLLVAISTILVMTGFCAAFDISPLLSCMALGTCYVNVGKNKQLFEQVNNFTPPILTIFFVLSGMRLNVPYLMVAGVAGVGYFLIRIIGKYLGAYIGATLSGSTREVKKYLGLALIPQAGVSIGLAILGQRILPTEIGTLLSVIILSSGVLYEMVGPASAKLALHLSGSFPRKKDELLHNKRA